MVEVVDIYHFHHAYWDTPALIVNYIGLFALICPFQTSVFTIMVTVSVEKRSLLVVPKPLECRSSTLGTVIYCLDNTETDRVPEQSGCPF